MITKNKNEKTQIWEVFNAFLRLNKTNLKRLCEENGLNYIQMWRMFNRNVYLDIDKVNELISLVDSSKGMVWDFEEFKIV